MGASFSQDGMEIEESKSRLLIHSELTQEYKDATHGVIGECYDELVHTFGGGLLTKFTLNDEEFDLVRASLFRGLRLPASPRRLPLTVERTNERTNERRRSSRSSSRIPRSTSRSG